MRVFVVTGAGISAESGIPTFRGKDGYWRNLDPTKLATPEAFAHDPNLVWDWYRERRAAHSYGAAESCPPGDRQLAERAREFLLVTQNVDDLHRRAGVILRKDGANPWRHFHHALLALRFQRRHEHDDDSLPKCPECGALMRPGVVWFGEQLDLEIISIVENFVTAGDCDLVIVAGTTALFGYITDWALRARGRTGQLIEVNPEATSLSQFATKSCPRTSRRRLAAAGSRTAKQLFSLIAPRESTDCPQVTFRRSRNGGFGLR